VQNHSGGSGEVLDAIRGTLDPWLGKPSWKQTGRRVTFNHRVDSEDRPQVAIRLKIEINTHVHFTVYGLRRTASRLLRAGLGAPHTCGPTSATNC